MSAEDQNDSPERDELDVEAFAKANADDCKKPHARFYVIRIDRDRKRVPEPELSGTQILALVGKDPATHKLFQKIRGHDKPRPVGPDEIVSFRRPGVERFETIPKDTTEGAKAVEAAAMRRQFELPEEDRGYLDGRGFRWETVVDGPARWVVIHDYPTVEGYNHRASCLGLEIPQSYADTQIDMVNFLPALARADGRPIGRLADRAFDGETWQQWSRHRTGVNPWRRGFDCIETHLLLVDEWLEREFRGAA